MFFPPGDQMAPSASVEMVVIFLGAPPGIADSGSILLTQTWQSPSTSLLNRWPLPSGDQRPPGSPAGVEGSWRASPPARGTTHRWVVFLFSLRSTSMAENMTHFPLGETDRPLTRLSAIMSSKVKGF